MTAFRRGRGLPRPRSRQCGLSIAWATRTRSAEPEAPTVFPAGNLASMRRGKARVYGWAVPVFPVVQRAFDATNVPGGGRHVRPLWDT
jgi:hypothetical protein